MKRGLGSKAAEICNNISQMQSALPMSILDAEHIANRGILALR